MKGFTPQYKWRTVGTHGHPQPMTRPQGVECVIWQENGYLYKTVLEADEFPPDTRWMPLSEFMELLPSWDDVHDEPPLPEPWRRLSEANPEIRTTDIGSTCVAFAWAADDRDRLLLKEHPPSPTSQTVVAWCPVFMGHMLPAHPHEQETKS